MKNLMLKFALFCVVVAAFIVGTTYPPAIADAQLPGHCAPSTDDEDGDGVLNDDDQSPHDSCSFTTTCVDSEGDVVSCSEPDAEQLEDCSTGEGDGADECAY